MNHDGHCERVTEHDPCFCRLRAFERFGTDSTPPETPLAKARRHPESLLPPRALPGAGVSAALVALASTLAVDSSLPVYKRAAGVVLLSLAAWLIGYFTQPPRRRFRRDDR